MTDSFKYILPGEEGFKGILLDEMLAQGFYRMQHFMFTCNETSTGDDLKEIPVFWLRTVVNKCTLSGAAKTILKKCSGFSVIVQEAETNSEIAELYNKYKQHITFKVAESPEDYLHHPYLAQPFDAMMIKVYDEKTLVAAGYFDKGKNTIAGIMNIYDPHYRSFSPGKFLILQKLRYALSQNMLYYYTGYISTQSVRFDYKTFPDVEAVEVFLPAEKIWVPFHNLGKTYLAKYYDKLLA